MDNQKPNGSSESHDQESQVEEHQNVADSVKELKDCMLQVEQWKEKFFRASADLQNYTKRAEKERDRLIHQIQAQFLLGVLAVVDDVDRAIEQAPQEIKDALSWLEGFILIQKKLYTFLDQYGVTEITDVIDFNPELHEAVMQVTTEEYKEGAIVKVLQKGFMLNDQVLRPAKVCVAT